MRCVPCKNKRDKPVGIDKLKSIYSGWKNVIWPSELVKNVAYDRVEICAECSQNKKTLCIDCGCWIPAKARSLSEICVLWNEVDKSHGL